MLACYQSDIARWAHALNSSIPPREASSGLRVLNWNINNLCGPTGKEEIEAAQVLEVVKSVDPDVIVMQEATTDPSPYCSA